MADEKRPFHEVLAKKLMFAPVGIASGLRDAKAAELSMILAVLQESKMPAEAAHKIAEDNAGLPELLTEVGQNYLAAFATEVLEDLRNRKDEEKKEGKTKAEVAEAVTAGG